MKNTELELERDPVSNNRYCKYTKKTNRCNITKNKKELSNFCIYNTKTKR